MDFFQAQDNARRNSRMLVFWFLVAVIGIIAAVYLALALGSRLAFTDQALAPRPLWQPELFVASVVGVGGLILLGSLFKIWSLSRNGGVKIAEELGGRLVSRSTADRLERRLINVVDEMAIASGIAAPPVFILDAEQGINAFAAGARISEGVVAVTRGALEKLSRDELQGVVAHEFSHILNGDMRLNLRLLGLLNGILLLTLAGRVMMRSARGSNRSAGPIIIAGIAMVIVGYIGVLCGKIIKAGVSRQREYLADAAAVQLTRNPTGIAGALKKIGGFGSSIEHPKAEEASHMFFGSSASFSSLLATHPPLGQRIKRIDPAFDEQAPVGLAVAVDTTDGSASYGQVVSGFSPQRFVEAVGDPQPPHVAIGHDLLTHLPQHVFAATHQTGGARALVFALLLSPDTKFRPAQMDAVGKQFGMSVREQTEEFAQWLADADPLLRLPLLDLALPTLVELSPEARAQVVDTADRLIKADGRTSLFEYVMRRLLRDVLEPQRKRTASVSLRTLQADTNALLTLLAHAGQDDGDHAAAAFEAAVAVAPMDGPWEFDRKRRFSARELDRILDHLAATGTPFRRKLVEAAATAVMHDGEVTASEAELLRAVCQALDCPAPPLLHPQ
jgi:Zn-dependent protease with chaperone function/tellurite resistance protein